MRKKLHTPSIFFSSILLAFFSLTVGAQESPKSNLRATHIPNTISTEARGFLKRMKGDIVANYLINSEGESAALAIYREAAPDMHIEETEFNGVKAYWFSSNKAVGKDAVVAFQQSPYDKLERIRKLQRAGN